MKACNFLWFFSLFFISSYTQAQEYMKLDDITNAAKRYLLNEMNKQDSYFSQNKVTIKSFSIDSRLQLKQCDKPLTFDHNQSSKIKGITAVKVSCSGPHAWAIYTKHDVTIQKTVVVINKNLPKHHILQANDVSYGTRNTTNLRSGYMTDTKLLVGKQLTRPIKEGQVLYRHQLTQAEIVKKGDKVNVSAKIGALTVVTSGIALADGRRGEQIDVENKRSSRIIRTIVTGPSAVEVIL